MDKKNRHCRFSVNCPYTITAEGWDSSLGRPEYSGNGVKELFRIPLASPSNGIILRDLLQYANATGREIKYFDLYLDTAGTIKCRYGWDANGGRYVDFSKLGELKLEWNY